MLMENVYRYHPNNFYNESSPVSPFFIIRNLKIRLPDCSPLVKIY